MRIKGVREPYAQLLQDAGVDTVKELKIPQSRPAGRSDERGEPEAQARAAVALGTAREGLDRGRQEARSEDQVLIA
jgi:hypothetical protein